MRSDVARPLAIALPLLATAGLVAAPKPRAAAPVQIPITGQAVDAVGNRYVLSGALTLSTEAVIPTPQPDPVSISYVTCTPNRLGAGESGQVTVILTRKLTTALRLMTRLDDREMTGSTAVDVPAGSDRGSFTVTVSATPVAAERYANVHVVYGTTDKYCTFVLQPGTTPIPNPLPGGGPSPRVEAITAPAGSPLVLPAERGQRVRVVGEGMGPEAGELWWNGCPLVILAWSDIEAVGRLSWPSGTRESVEVRTKAGGFWGGMLQPDEPWPSPPEQDHGTSSLGSRSGSRAMACSTVLFSLSAPPP
jgi:hypothetical protein